MANAPVLISVKQLASRLGCFRTTIYRWVKNGHLRHGVYRGAGGRKFLRFDEEAVLKELRENARWRRGL